MKPMCAVLAVVAACVGPAGQVQVVTLPAQPAPGPWLTLRDALNECALAHGLAGEVRVRIELHPDGVPGEVASAHGDSFDVCIGRSIGRWRFNAYRGQTIDVPYQVRGPA